MSIPFWFDDPTILFNKSYINELWPTNVMTYEQKLNAITRLIIILTIIGYIFTLSIKLLFVFGVTIIMIQLLYLYYKNNNNNDDDIKRKIEGMTNYNDKKSNIIRNPETLETFLKTDFKEGTKKNPFSNVLLTQINDEPERKLAPPAFNVDVSEDITKNVKKAIQYMNPGIKNTDKQLFGDLWSNFELDQSNRRFFSTANTRVSNDQTAYANFLYGNMPSAKDSTAEGNLQREKDNYRYTLY